MYRLFISSEEAELSPKSKVQLSKSIFNLEDITERGITFTNAFTLPFTGKNDRLTGYPSRLASNNKAFEQNKPFYLLDNSGIVARGDVIVKSFDDQKGIKIQLAEGFGFWSQAGKKLLNDLVVDSEDFVFNTANMNTLKTKGSNIFLTALHSATGTGSGTALTNYQYTRPCIYFRVVADYIVSELGYTIDYGDVLTDTMYNDIGCLSNATVFFVSDMKRKFENLAFNGDIDVSTGSSVFAKAGNTSITGTVITNNLYETSYVVKGYVNATSSSELLFDFDGNVERVLVPAGDSFVNFRSDEVEIGTNLTISTSANITFESVHIYSAISEADIFDVAGAINIDDYLVLADYNLPQQTYKQFLKTLMSINFLDFSIDEANKAITVRSLNVEIDTNNAIDLSGAVSRYAEFKSGSTYGQLNEMSYGNDEDISPTLGALFFNVENQNAQETKSFIKIDRFSASNEITVSSETIVVAPIYDTTENKRSSVKDRIVFFQSTGAFGINAMFSPASMQRIYSRFYVDFVSATKRERSSVMSVNLTKLQFKRLQNKPVIYVDFLRSHLLVLNVEGFDDKSLCKLSVLKYG